MHVNLLSSNKGNSLLWFLIHTACLMSIAGKLPADNHRLFAEKDKKRGNGERSDALFCKAKNHLKVFRMTVDNRAALFMADVWRRVAQIDKRQNRAIEKILMHRPIQGRALAPARPAWLLPPGSPAPKLRVKHGVWFIQPAKVV